MAADELSKAGVCVTIADQMPSPARKFLMAGKSGLNLAHASGGDAPYGDMPPALAAALRTFGAQQVSAWAEELGQATFTGSTGRIFPKTMKASPLLRTWLARLNAQGVTLNRRWRWTDWDGPAVQFDTPDGPRAIAPDVTILALGGGSWARLGSDGAWAHSFSDTAPFRPANCGFAVQWSHHMAPVFGQPVKATRLTALDQSSRGEWVLTSRGIEGGGIYDIAAAVRDGATLKVDLLPDTNTAALTAKMARRNPKRSLSHFLKNTLRLPPVKIALVQELGRSLPLIQALKSLPLPHTGPLPIDQAISTAGGLRFDALDDHLMLRARTGTFAAGEMLDWEAPTGGYLITACLATGRHAARGALAWLATHT